MSYYKIKQFTAEGLYLLPFFVLYWLAVTNH